MSIKKNRMGITKGGKVSTENILFLGFIHSEFCIKQTIKLVNDTHYFFYKTTHIFLYWLKLLNWSFCTNKLLFIFIFFYPYGACNTFLKFSVNSTRPKLRGGASFELLPTCRKQCPNSNATTLGKVLFARRLVGIKSSRKKAILKEKNCIERNKWLLTCVSFA